MFRDGQRVTVPGFSHNLSFGLGKDSMSYVPAAPYNWDPNLRLTLNTKTGQNTVSIWAVGYAWIPAADRFETVKVLDKQGTVIHTHTRTD